MYVIVDVESGKFCLKVDEVLFVGCLIKYEEY